jgi:hypothetical protein
VEVMFKPFSHFQEKAKRQKRWLCMLVSILTGVALIFALPDMGHLNYIVLICSITGAYLSYFIYSFFFKKMRFDEEEFIRQLLSIDKADLDAAKEQGILTTADIRRAKTALIDRKWLVELGTLEKKLK